MEWSQLILWAILILFILAAYFIHRHRKKKCYELGLTEFVNTAMSSYAVIVSSELMYLAGTSQELKSLLGNDIVTLFVGALAVIWVSIQQILKLF